MSDKSAFRTAGTALFLTLIMVLSMVAMSATFVGGVGAGPASLDESGTETGSITETAIDDDVAEATGQTQLVIRLADPHQVAGFDDQRNQIEQLQEPILDELHRLDAVTVESTFWVTNAILVEVDLDEIAVEELASIQSVERIHSNFELSIPGQGIDLNELDDKQLQRLADAHDEFTIENLRELQAKGSNAPEQLVRPADTGELDQQDYTYGLEQINAPQAWDAFDNRGDGVRVAVLDTGVDADHPDIELAPGGWGEFDENGTLVNSTPHDTDGHGTHVSGTVAASSEPADPSIPAYGVAPDADLMHGLVLPDGSGTFAQILGGMQWAAENDAEIISMSLGATLGTDISPGSDAANAFVDPIRNLEEQDVKVVSSIGNDGENFVSIPGAEYETFGIGASDSNLNIAGFSSGMEVPAWFYFGEPLPPGWPDEYIKPDLAAPGVDVLSALPGGGYGYLSGTSMATPHVAGVMALMSSNADETLTNDDVRDVLETASFKPEDAPDAKDTRYGHGIVDAAGATALAEAGVATVGGTVVDNETGDGIEGATVNVVGTNLGVVTDENGEYELVAPADEIDIEANAFGFTPIVETVDLSDSESVTLDIEASGNLAPDDFQVLENPMGDVNEDGEVTIVDAVLIQQYLAEMLDEDQTFNETLADVNRDGDITIVDAVLIQQMLAEMTEGSKLEVSELQAPSSAQIGDEILVNATIENTGDIGAIERVQYRLGGEVIDSEVIDIGAAGTGNEVQLARFAIDTSELESGIYEHGIFSSDDNSTTTIDLQPTHDAEVDFTLDHRLEVDEAVDAPFFGEIGGEYTVSHEVANLESFAVELNDSSTADPRDLSVLVNGDEVDFGEEVSFDRYWGDLNVTIVVADEQRMEDETVILDLSFSGLDDTVETTMRETTLTPEVQPANFEISDVETPSALEVEEGMTTHLNATITNTGHEPAERFFWWSFGEDRGIAVSWEIQLNPGETVEFESGPVSGLEGFFDGGQIVPHGPATVHSVFFNPIGVDDVHIEDVALLEQGTDVLQVTELGPDRGDAGEEITATAEVINLGTETSTQTVRYQLDGELMANKTVSVDPAVGPDDTKAVEFDGIELPDEEDYSTTQYADTDDDHLDNTMAVGFEDNRVVDVTVIQSVYQGGAETASLIGENDALVSAEVVTWDDGIDESVVDESDVLVIQNLDVYPHLGTIVPPELSDQAKQFVKDVEADDTTGVIYIGGNDIVNSPQSEGLNVRSLATGDPGEVLNSAFGETIYNVTADHPLFEGVAEPGEEIAIRDDSWGYQRYDDTNADVLAIHPDDELPIAAVDPDTSALMMGGVGNAEQIDVEDHTQEGVQVFLNAVHFSHVEHIGIIEGSVTDEVTGEPVEGVTIHAETEDDVEFTAVTDEDGQYEIWADVPGTYVVNPTDAPEGYTLDALVTVEMGETVTQDFELTPDDPVIVGEVTDAGTGDAIEDAEVFDADSTDHFSVLTESDGTFSVDVTDISGLNQGDQVAIRADHEDYEQSSIVVITIGPGENEVDFALTASATESTATQQALVLHP